MLAKNKDICYVSFFGSVALSTSDKNSTKEN